MRPATTLALIFIMTITGCPTPQPNPHPTPAVKLVVVYESKTATHDQQDVINSMVLRNWLDQHHIWYRFVDRDILDPQDHTPDEVASFLLHAEKKPIPWLMAADAANNLIAERELPPTDLATIQVLTPLVAKQ